MKTVRKSPAIQFRLMIEENGTAREPEVRKALEDATTYVRNQREYLVRLRITRVHPH